MHKQIIHSDRLQESYLRLTHESGLTILLYPMKGFSSTYALFGTQYGSIDRTFKTDQDSDFITVPDGIAHFLEHKLFEGEDGEDAFTLYAKTGASANAFTSFDRTAYLFSCSDHLEESLGILLDFVQSPFFSEQTVQKEQGIIGQEIRMYDDDAGWRVFFNALGAMYQNHAIKVDIAGTVESISQIDAQLLYRCYHTFYNLSNMVLVLAGSFEPKEVQRVIEQHLKSAEPVNIERGRFDEPAGIVMPRVEISLEVAIPQFCIGFKMPPSEGLAQLKAEVECELINSILVGEGSPLYRELYDSGLVSAGAISSEVLDGRGYFSVLFEGESRDPDQVRQKLWTQLQVLNQQGIGAEDFECTKKMLYGQAVWQFSSVEALASNLLSAGFDRLSVYDRIEAIATTSLQDLQNRLLQYQEEHCVLSVVSSVQK